MDNLSQIFQSYRKDFFKKIPLSDVHQIISFEKLIRNYVKMKELLKNDKQ
jgi:hypothetical protein